MASLNELDDIYPGGYSQTDREDFDGLRGTPTARDGSDPAERLMIATPSRALNHHAQGENHHEIQFDNLRPFRD
jgi:hypothetical protein